MKETARWFSPNVQQETQLVRWGTYGTPVLLFPTAAGDAEEIERFLMIQVLAPLLKAGRVKIYSVDSIAGAAWISKKHSPPYCSRLQTLFARYIVDEVVPAIRADCRTPRSSPPAPRSAPSTPCRSSAATPRSSPRQSA